jgi:hypothetical protein
MSDLITLPRATVQQALEALEELNGWQSLAPPLASQAGRQAAISLRAALEQPEPEQEPLAIATVDESLGVVFKFSRSHTLLPGQMLYVYTHPPRREWQGLTDEEIQSVIQLEREKRFQRRPPLPLSMTELSHAIEAKLKEKNYE